MYTNQSRCDNRLALELLNAAAKQCKPALDSQLGITCFWPSNCHPSPSAASCHSVPPAQPQPAPEPPQVTIVNQAQCVISIVS